MEILPKQSATQGHQRPEVTVKNLVTHAVETHNFMDLIWGRPAKGDDEADLNETQTRLSDQGTGLESICRFPQ